MAENKTVYEKLHQVQQELKCNKSQFNSFGKYYYRSCEDILEGLKTPLKKVGCCVLINDELVDIAGKIYVKATASFVDSNGASIVNSAYAREGETQSGMSPAQLTGATSSYARKYALNGLFLIDDNKDADTNESKIEKEERQKRSKQPTQEEMKNVGSQKIDEKKQNILMKQCEDCGINPVIVVDKLGVANFSEITEKQFVWLKQNWSKEIVGASKG